MPQNGHNPPGEDSTHINRGSVEIAVAVEVAEPRSGGETGKRMGLKIPRGEILMWVRSPPRAFASCCRSVTSALGLTPPVPNRDGACLERAQTSRPCVYRIPEVVMNPTTSYG